MKLLIAMLAISLIVGICHGQGTALSDTNGVFQFNEQPFRHVEFSISLGTNIFAANTTNVLQCKISNFSTNIILYSKQMLIIYLTNDSGACHILFEHPKPIFTIMGASGPSIDVEPLETGNATRWPVDFVIGNAVIPGSYRLVAREIVQKQGATLMWSFHSVLNIDVTKTGNP